MNGSHLYTEFHAKVISLFLELAPVKLRQLLHQCELSTGWNASESTLRINCTSLSEVEVLQAQAWYMALAAKILGIRIISISHHHEPVYNFSVEFLLHCPE